MIKLSQLKRLGQFFYVAGLFMNFIENFVDFL